jgi:hypothetical protein
MKASSPTAGHRVQAGVDQFDAPVGREAVDDLARAVPQVDAPIAVMEEVVAEVFLDDRALVSARHDEVPEAAVRVDAHDVP